MGSNVYKFKHKKLGLCPHCSRIVKFNFKHCELHLQYQKDRRNKHKEEGKCQRCGLILHEDMDNGYLSCLNCRELKFYQRRGHGTNQSTNAC